jgi:hypothetical protein
VQAEKDTAERFLKQVLRPQDQALLVGFSSTVKLWQDFTDSPSLLRATLENLHAVPFRGVPKDGGPAPAHCCMTPCNPPRMTNFKRFPAGKPCW